MRRSKVERLAGILILAACMVGVVNAKASQGGDNSGDSSDVPAKQAALQKHKKSKATRAERKHTNAKNQPKVAATKSDASQVSLLRQQLALQQKQINQLLHAVAELNARLGSAAQPAPVSALHPADSAEVASLVPILPAHLPEAGKVASLVPVLPASTAVNAGVGSSPAGITLAPPSPVAGQSENQNSVSDSPLQFHIGSAYVTPVGFMDFTSVWRNHDGGSGIGTNFAGIPYGNVFQNNLSEFRMSMQNSRVGFRVDALVKGAHVIGYMESDFLGNNPGNFAVSSNSNTLRSRLFWLDVRKGPWEVLGGQTWSLITPGRTGVSPLPGDIFFTNNIDVNYQLGLFWGRLPEFRLVYHPSTKAALAFAVDSPEQYVGGSAGGPLITFPSALALTYASELNTGGNGAGVPNVAPDFIAKLALDPSKEFHFEIGGVERNFKLWNPTNRNTYSTTGGGGFLNLNFELFKGFRLLTNNFWGDGGGRYIFGQAPDLIVRANGSPSLIHASSTVSGLEFTHKNTLLYSYYGGLYIGRNIAIDTNGDSVGYGYTGAPSGQNRAIQEATFGFNQTIWKDAKWGAINFMGQYSYLTRNPWSVATGSPANSALHMVFLNLRYTLPGSAPTLK